MSSGRPRATTCLLVAIRKHGGEWRESRIPTELRDDGVLQVTLEVCRRRFRLGYEVADRGSGYEVQLSGMVWSDGDGGSRIVARCRPPGMPVWAYVMLAVLFAHFATGDGWLTWLWAAGVLAAGSLWWVWREREMSPSSSPATRHLMSRLEGAITIAEGRIAAPPSP